MKTMNSGVIQLDIVSAENEIFSGEVLSLFATGELGELGILPGHTPLLTQLAPGEIRATMLDNQTEVFYISGGMLEIQPNHVTVLSDTAMRAEDINEAAAQEAKRKAEDIMNKRDSDVDFYHAAIELARATAQLRALQKIRRKSR